MKINDVLILTTIQNSIEPEFLKDYIIPFLVPLVASITGGLITLGFFKHQEKISFQNKMRVEFYNDNREIFDNMIDICDILKNKVERLKLFKDDKINECTETIKMVSLLDKKIDEVLKCLDKNGIILVPDKKYLELLISSLNNIKESLYSTKDTLEIHIDKNINKCNYSCEELEINNKIIVDTILNFVAPMLHLHRNLLTQMIIGKYFLTNKDYKKIKRIVRKTKIYNFYKK